MELNDFISIQIVSQFVYVHQTHYTRLICIYIFLLFSPVLLDVLFVVVVVVAPTNILWFCVCRCVCVSMLLI